MIQFPWVLVCVWYFTPVSSEVTVTIALVTTAPCASVTRPPSFARASCGAALTDTQRYRAAAKKKARLLALAAVCGKSVFVLGRRISNLRDIVKSFGTVVRTNDSSN